MEKREEEEETTVVRLKRRRRQPPIRSPAAQREFDAMVAADAKKRRNRGLELDRPPRVILFSEALDHDMSPEVIKKKNYVNFALTQSKASETVEVVQIGPLAVGDLFEDYHILHMNFNVKNSQGVVNTFFCELKHTITNDHLHRCQIWNLGPAHLLPENANTEGCLHCSSHNIHHPKGQRTFQNGGILYLISMCSKIRTAEHYLSERNHITEADFNERFPEPGIVYLPQISDFTMERFASVALQIYNTKESSNFELVKIARCGKGRTAIGNFYHLNFEAKKKGDVDEAVQTFFAQALQRPKFFIVDYCSCLGLSSLLPYEADIRGCVYCRFYYGVHHPINTGYLTGREYDFYNPPRQKISCNVKY